MNLVTTSDINIGGAFVKRRGPAPKPKVDLKWSGDFAYAIGLIVSDGNVGKNFRTISFASKDKDQIQNFLNALNLKNPMGIVNTGLKNQTYRTQISDAYFWSFLSLIGVHSNKSKTIGSISVPEDFFFDFLRGVFDGDGSVYSYWDKRWKSSFMFYISFASASEVFITWLQNRIKNILNIEGHFSIPSKNSSTWQLKYAKTEAKLLISRMYTKRDCVALNRKRLKIEEILGTIATTDSM